MDSYGGKRSLCGNRENTHLNPSCTPQRMENAFTHITIRIILSLLLATQFATALLAPSEILYDPAGADNGLEFIELVGGDNLTGCATRDLASADTLELLRAPDAGNELILIVESDGVYGNLTTGAAVYGAGAAIGNGLGNTAEQVTVSCGGADLLTIAYDTTALPDIPAGVSIVWRDGAWAAGEINGTPGIATSIALNDTPQEPPGNTSGNGTGSNTTEPPVAEPPVGAWSSGAGGAGGMPPACNSTLLLTVGATEGYPEQVITFTIVSPEYASWEAMTDDGMLAYGDTLTSRTHAITLPHGVSDVRLIAESRACDGRQRTTRHLTVLPERVPAPMIAHNESAARSMPIAAEPAEPSIAVTQPVPEARAADTRPGSAADMPTGAVILDEDRVVLPWIAGFGIVTVLASAGVFLVVHRGERKDAGTAPILGDGRGASDRDGSRVAHRGGPSPRTRPSGGRQDGRAVSEAAFVDEEAHDGAEAKYISPPVAQAGDDDDR